MKEKLINYFTGTDRLKQYNKLIPSKYLPNSRIINNKDKYLGKQIFANLTNLGGIALATITSSIEPLIAIPIAEMIRYEANEMARKEISDYIINETIKKTAEKNKKTQELFKFNPKNNKKT